jgi:two-component system cell cycle sensor histidine kinase/response regulator CckA
MNKAFHVAAGINAVDTPTYPGDLVAKEDKAAVADAVRRNARDRQCRGSADPAQAPQRRAGTR